MGKFDGILLASDMDGTLLNDQREIGSATIEALNYFTQNGGRFALATGRTRPATAAYRPLLPCNAPGVYLNGAIICDADGKVLFEGRIEPRILKAVSEEPCVQSSFHFAFSAKDRTYLCHESEGSWIMREGKQWDFPVLYIEEKDILTLPQIHQFSLGFADPADSTAAAEALNAKYGDYLHAYPNRCSLDITPPGISKSSGIEHLKQLMGWQDAGRTRPAWTYRLFDLMFGRKG